MNLYNILNYYTPKYANIVLTLYEFCMYFC